MTPTPTTTHNYAYNNSAWGDQLTSYNGQSIAYDAIGNPTTYYNGTQYTNMTWEQGRNLTFFMMGLSYVNFEYNDQGIRTSKTLSNGTTYNYILDGTRIVAETWSDELLIYLYDDNGSPIGMQSRYSGYAENEFDTYWFEKNLQGDIIAVYNENGVKLVAYTYDAWGNFTTTYCNGGENDYALDFNPFRYRGYYYDEETGFYYLNSRYYDPVTGRFINADGYVSTGQGILGNNMYAYCNNNPVMCVDGRGDFPVWIIVVVVAAIIVAVDHALAMNEPDGVALVGDPSGDYEEGFNERILYAKGGGISFEGTELTIVDSQLGVYDGTTKRGDQEFSLTRFGTANAKLSADLSGKSATATAIASIYTIGGKGTIDLGIIKVKYTGNIYVGSASFGAEYDIARGEFSAVTTSVGISAGGSIDIDWIGW